MWETATLAQLVEHSPCKRTVVSSNLTGGSISPLLTLIDLLPSLAKPYVQPNMDKLIASFFTRFA